MGGFRIALAGALIGFVSYAGAGIAGAGSTDAGANDDVYSTPFQTPKVLTAPAPTDNDIPEVEANVFDSEILTLPANGTLSAPIGDPVDGITYTPNAGFTGVDSFTYEYMWGFDFGESEFEVEANPFECANFGQARLCFSTATVTITVGAPPPTTTTTVAPTTTTTPPTTVAAAVITTTTVAAQATLPVTGNGNGPLVFGGFGVLLLGAGALVIARRHARG